MIKFPTIILERSEETLTNPKHYDWLQLPITEHYERVVEIAKLEQVILIKSQVSRLSSLLVWVGWVLLSLVLLVSFVHSAITIGELTPQKIEVWGWVHSMVSWVFTFVVDLTAIYLFATTYLLAYSRMPFSKWYTRYILTLTYCLNLAFVGKYSGWLIFSLVKPVLDELFVLALPAFVVLAILGLKRATEMLTLGHLKLQVEVAAYNQILKEKVQA